MNIHTQEEDVDLDEGHTQYKVCMQTNVYHINEKRKKNIYICKVILIIPTEIGKKIRYKYSPTPGEYSAKGVTVA